jgi:hypothetical protein
MKTTFESYEELAEAMCEGGGILHNQNCPGYQGCADWQLGVMTFARWLDYLGMPHPVTDGKRGFYEFSNSSCKPHKEKL